MMMIISLLQLWISEVEAGQQLVDVEGLVVCTRLYWFASCKLDLPSKPPRFPFNLNFKSPKCAAAWSTNMKITS